MSLVLKLEKERKKHFFLIIFFLTVKWVTHLEFVRQKTITRSYYIFLNKRFTYLVNNDNLCLNSTLTFEKLSGSII